MSRGGARIAVSVLLLATAAAPVNAQVSRAAACAADAKAANLNKAGIIHLVNK